MESLKIYFEDMLMFGFAISGICFAISLCILFVGAIAGFINYFVEFTHKLKRRKTLRNIMKK